MRMWKVPTRVLCRQHLLGEHVEMHMFVGSYKKNINLKGYIDKGLLDPNYMLQRHTELITEMPLRGYNHKSPIDEEVCELISKDYGHHTSLVDVDGNIRELIKRCDICEEMIAEFYE
tara:strand:+ start:70 stop:420 length:351 start_codon:yes stop_codon:yes gene_type:complete